MAATDTSVFPIWSYLRVPTNRQVFTATGRLGP
jgi:hypothetical protein